MQLGPFANPHELIMPLPTSARFSTVDKHGCGTSVLQVRDQITGIGKRAV